MKQKRIDVKLLKKASKGDQVSANELFKLCEGTIREVFYPKICRLERQEWKKLKTPDGLSKLCEETFDRVIEEIKSPEKIDVDHTSYSFHKHCRDTANRVWSDLATAANQGDHDAFNKLFMLCRRQMKAKFRSQLGPHTELEDDLCHELFLLAKQKIIETPYDEKKGSFYTYLNSIVGAKYLALRVQGSGVVLSLPDGYRSIYKIPKEIPASDYARDNETASDIIERVPEVKTPETLLLEKEEEILAPKGIRQQLLIKMATLQFCALCSKPHQFIGFGFNKWLGWKTRDVANEFGGKQMDQLSHKLLELTHACLNEPYNIITAEELNDFFSPLFRKIEKYVREIYKEKEYREFLSGHADSIIKGLFIVIFTGLKPPANMPFERISDWFAKETVPPQKISDWTDKVRRSTFNALNVRETQSDHVS
jgi:DNA-directed RNA polymerase specialized sigma24 family protein